MLRRLGPAGLLRLATAITLGVSLLTGCSPTTPDRPQGTATGAHEGWTRCDRDHAGALTVVCFQR